MTYAELGNRCLTIWSILDEHRDSIPEACIKAIEKELSGILQDLRAQFLDDESERLSQEVKDILREYSIYHEAD